MNQIEPIETFLTREAKKESEAPTPLAGSPVGNEGPSTFTAWYIGDETSLIPYESGQLDYKHNESNKISWIRFGHDNVQHKVVINQSCHPFLYPPIQLCLGRVGTNMGVSKNNGTPKRMVYKGKWMIWGYHYF